MPPCLVRREAAGDDQWIAISIAGDAQWRALKRSLGDPEWMSLKKFSTVRERRANRTDLDEQLARETRKHEAGTLASALLAGGVPAAPLLDARGIASHTLFRNRALFEMVEHPVLKSVSVYRVPWQVNGNAVAVTRRAPLLGEHNAYVLQTLLGYSEERLKSLQETGVFR